MKIHKDESYNISSSSVDYVCRCAYEETDRRFVSKHKKKLSLRIALINCIFSSKVVVEL